MTQDLAKRQKREVSNTAAERLGESGVAYAPDVDIYETNDELIFGIDLPGVEKGNVKIEVDENNTLIVRATTSHKELEQPMLKQYNVGNYYRAFQISDEYDKEKITGKLENGLLRLTIPKREEVKPKRIEIKA